MANNTECGECYYFPIMIHLLYPLIESLNLLGALLISLPSHTSIAQRLQQVKGLWSESTWCQSNSDALHTAWWGWGGLNNMCQGVIVSETKGDFSEDTNARKGQSPTSRTTTSTITWHAHPLVLNLFNAWVRRSSQGWCWFLCTWNCCRWVQSWTGTKANGFTVDGQWMVVHTHSPCTAG